MLVGRGDEDDAVNATAPVGEDAFLFAAGTGVADYLKDKRGLDDSDGRGIAGEDLFHPLLLGGDDGRMDDGVEVVEAATLEGELSETGAVDSAVWAHDFGAECADDLGVDGLAGFHHLAAKRVGFNDVGAEFTEKCRRRCFCRCRGRR